MGQPAAAAAAAAATQAPATATNDTTNNSNNSPKLQLSDLRTSHIPDDNATSTSATTPLNASASAANANASTGGTSAFQPGSAEYDLASLLANVKGTGSSTDSASATNASNPSEKIQVDKGDRDAVLNDGEHDNQQARGEQDSNRRLSTSSQQAMHMDPFAPARSTTSRSAAELAYAALARSRGLYPAVTSQEYHDSIHEGQHNGLNEEDFEEEEEEDDDGMDDQPMMSGALTSRRHKPSAMQHLHNANGTSSRSGRKIKASSKQQAATAASQYVSSAEALMSVIRSTKGHRPNANKPTSGSKPGAASSSGQVQITGVPMNKGGSSGIIDEGNTGGGLYSGTTNPRHTNICPGPSKIPSKDAAEMFPGLPSAPAPCPFEGCGKMFGRRSDFKRHWRVHSGERPWRCDVPGCDKGFVQVRRRSSSVFFMRS
jgi:hypothetical protein